LNPDLPATAIGGETFLSATSLVHEQCSSHFPQHAVIRHAENLPPFGGDTVNSIIYLVGLVVVVLFILSLLGLR
jgi:hypothetical protein